MPTNAPTCTCLAFLLLLAAPASASPPDKPLLPQATRVIALENPIAMGIGAMQVSTPWLSDHQLLHVRRDTLYLYDTVAHTDTALPKLTHQVKSSDCPIVFLTAAPGAPWVMWGQSANSPIYAAAVDGSRRWQWPGNGGMTMPYWCADGQHLIRFLFDGSNATTVHYTRALMDDVDAPKQSQVIADLPPGLRPLEVLDVVSEHEVVARTPDPVTFGGATRLPKSVERSIQKRIQKLLKKLKKTAHSSDVIDFTISEQDTQRAVQDISVWDLDAPTPLHHYVVHLPARVEEVAVSPEGDRVAWLLMPQAGRAPSTSLWVSGLDGGGLHEIGSARWDVPSRGGGVPVQIHWLPGGRKISFIGGDSLWTVPAE